MGPWVGMRGLPAQDPGRHGTAESEARMAGAEPPEQLVGGDVQVGEDLASAWEFCTEGPI